jgi:tryptophan halogenase
MRIAIVGGGTAGWLAALMISKVHKNTHDITVIESSKIGIIGAGEGSTGYLTDIIQNNTWDYGCNEEDFFRETGATVKLGIKHRDWAGIGKTYYGPIDGTNTSGGNPDIMLCHAIANDIPFHTASYNGYLLHENRASYQYDGDVLNSTKTNSYHFDAHKVGRYFKKITETEGVKHIDAEVLEVIQDERGIAGLKLSDDRTIEADFFIDCTGFARKLMNAMDIKWTSYQKNLPVNAAMPFLMPYEEGERIEPVTTAWAQSSGWMWQIPVAERWGCGYVYDSNFISDDQAHAEIEAALGRRVDPIRFLKFDTGRLDKLWHKNCLALGLCAAFAEPLEATSIHSTIVQLTSFIWDCLRDTRDETQNSGLENLYNIRMIDMYENFKDFLVLHYQTPRQDTEFWRWMHTGETRTDFVNNILDVVKTRIPRPGDFPRFYGYAGSPLYNWVLAGLGYIDKDLAERDMKFYGVDRNLANISWKIREDDMMNICKNMLDNTEFSRRYA